MPPNLIGIIWIMYFSSEAFAGALFVNLIREQQQQWSHYVFTFDVKKFWQWSSIVQVIMWHWHIYINIYTSFFWIHMVLPTTWNCKISPASNVFQSVLDILFYRFIHLCDLDHIGQLEYAHFCFCPQEIVVANGMLDQHLEVHGSCYVVSLQIIHYSCVLFFRRSLIFC